MRVATVCVATVCVATMRIAMMGVRLGRLRVRVAWVAVRRGRLFSGWLFSGRLFSGWCVLRLGLSQRQRGPTERCVVGGVLGGVTVAVLAVTVMGIDGKMIGEPNPERQEGTDARENDRGHGDVSGRLAVSAKSSAEQQNDPERGERRQDGRSQQQRYEVHAPSPSARRRCPRRSTCGCCRSSTRWRAPRPLRPPRAQSRTRP